MTQEKIRRFFLTHTHWIFAVAFFLIVSVFICFVGVSVHYMMGMKAEMAQQMEVNERHIDHLKAGISQDNVRRRNVIATEQLIHEINPAIAYETRLDYATILVDAVEKMPTVDLPLALAVITVESKFSAYSYSEIIINGKTRRNAVGIFQIISGTGRFIASNMNIPYSDTLRYDAKSNINMGIWYLQHLITETGDIEHALAYFMDGNVGLSGWGARNKYSTDEEFKNLTVDKIAIELEREDIDQETRSKLKAYLAAKELPTQTKTGVPKIMALRAKYIEYFRKADIYTNQTQSIK